MTNTQSTATDNGFDPAAEAVVEIIFRGKPIEAHNFGGMIDKYGTSTEFADGVNGGVYYRIQEHCNTPALRRPRSSWFKQNGFGSASEALAAKKQYDKTLGRRAARLDF